jgi:hypothetical protein
MQMTRQLPGKQLRRQIVSFELDMNGKGRGQAAIRAKRR